MMKHIGIAYQKAQSTLLIAPPIFLGFITSYHFSFLNKTNVIKEHEVVQNKSVSILIPKLTMFEGMSLGAKTALLTSTVYIPIYYGVLGAGHEVFYQSSSQPRSLLRFMKVTGQLTGTYFLYFSMFSFLTVPAIAVIGVLFTPLHNWLGGHGFEYKSIRDVT